MASKSSSIPITASLHGGAGFAGKSGRKTANFCDTSAKEMSNDTAAHCMLAKNNFTEIEYLRAILLPTLMVTHRGQLVD